jgi:AbiV family abortive infection protein
VLGLEELAKTPMLVNTFLRFEHGVDREAWQTYWKSGGWHRAKQELILSYGQVIRSLFDGDPVHGKYLYRYYAPESVLERLDSFKQSNLYVDLRRDGVNAPSGDANTRDALDYLMTFGQERADSFASWHATEARSRDYLELALGRASPEKWTSHHDATEIRADILYQATALGASQVPNYATFNDYVQQYRSKVSEELLEEAILSLCDSMRARIERSKSLSFFYARYLNAFKLLLGLSQLRIVGTEFGGQIEERLLPGRIAASRDDHAAESPDDSSHKMRFEPAVPDATQPTAQTFRAAKRKKDMVKASRRRNRRKK